MIARNTILKLLSEMDPNELIRSPEHIEAHNLGNKVNALLIRHEMRQIKGNPPITGKDGSILTVGEINRHIDNIRAFSNFGDVQGKIDYCKNLLSNHDMPPGVAPIKESQNDDDNVIRPTFGKPSAGPVKPSEPANFAKAFWDRKQTQIRDVPASDLLPKEVVDHLNKTMPHVTVSDAERKLHERTSDSLFNRVMEYSEGKPYNQGAIQKTLGEYGQTHQLRMDDHLQSQALFEPDQSKTRPHPAHTSLAQVHNFLAKVDPNYVHSDIGKLSSNHLGRLMQNDTDNPRNNALSAPERRVMLTAQEIGSVEGHLGGSATARNPGWHDH